MENICVQKDTVNLLWTGGWDSTFRLLQLTIGECKVTQPFYLMDPKRRSTRQEIRVMGLIKDRLFAEHPHLEEFILPTKYVEVGDIPQNASITDAFLRVASRNPIGEQYDWLARWCAEHEICDVELCIHRDDKACKAIKRYITESSVKDNLVHTFDNKFNNTDEFLLFRYYHFPVLDLSKLDIKHEAISKGFGSYLEMTWFCHNPSPRLTPCGICNPCRYSVEEGLGYRIPLLSRVKYHVQEFFVKTLKHRAPVLYSVGKAAARKIGWA